MTPVLYASNETNFIHMGIGALVDTTAAHVVEERNGMFELEMVYPVSGPLYDRIQKGNIIKAKANDDSSMDSQLFRIYSIGKTMDNTGKLGVNVKAKHISYDLFYNPINKFSVSNVNANTMLNTILTNTIYPHNFTGISDDANISSSSLEHISARAALGGVEGSLLDGWRGEFTFDNYLIRFSQNRGVDTGVLVAYGKNLIDIDQEEVIDETYTSIYPFATIPDEEGNETVIELPEKTLDSEYVGNFPSKRCLNVDLSGDDVTDVTSLRSKAQSYLVDNSIGKPIVSLTVSFAMLWQTKEYKDIAPLEHINLCDWVTVRFAKLGIDVKAKVIRTDFDTITEKYISVDLGDPKNNLATDIQQMQNDIQDNTVFVTKVMKTANGKNTIFSGSVEPVAFNVNDIWFKDLGNGVTKLMKWNGLLWYSPTDEAVKKAQDTADSKSNNSYDDQEPNIEDHKPGDMWYKPILNQDGTTTYQVHKLIDETWSDMFDDSAYQAQKQAANAQALAESKAHIFRDETPVPPYSIGDLWIESGFTKYCTVEKSVGGIFDDSDWTLQKIIIGSLDDSVQKTLNDSTQMGKMDLEVWARHYMASPTIVTNPEEKAYTIIIGFTNMQQVLGGAFNGTLQENDYIQGGIDTPSTAWALINMVKLYKLYGDQKYLDMTNLIANYFIGHTIDCNYWGSPFKAMPNAWMFNWDTMSWDSPKTGFIHIRSFYHTIWALLEAYSISPVEAYKTTAQQLLDGVATFTEDIKARIGRNEISPYMVGSQYNTINSDDGAAFTPVSNQFTVTSLDVIVKSISKYVELFGNETRTNSEGVSYDVQGIMNDAVSHVVDMYNNHGLRRPDGHNLLYCFEYFSWDDPVDAQGRYVPYPCNWDFINDVWGVDQWFTGDLEYWIIKGLAYSGHNDIAQSLIDRYYELRVQGKGEEILFYDRMDKDGLHLSDDQSISISFTALFMAIEDVLGINNYSYKCAETLKKYQIVSVDKIVDGGFPWDVNTPGQLVEGKTLGEIIYSPLEKIDIYFNMSDVLNGSPLTYSIADRIIENEQGIIGSVKKNTSYKGVVIDNSGLYAIAGPLYIELNSDEGFKITNGSTIMFQASIDGNLKVNGSGTFSGDLSAINFNGDDLQLYGNLHTHGSIDAANYGVIIDNNGIYIGKGSLYLNNTTIDENGNFTTVNGNFSGTLNAAQLNGGSLAIHGGGIAVDAGGQQIWLDGNGFHSSKNGFDTWINSDGFACYKNGVAKFMVDTDGNIIARDGWYNGNMTLYGTFNIPTALYGSETAGLKGTFDYSEDYSAYNSKYLTGQWHLNSAFIGFESRVENNETGDSYWATTYLGSSTIKLRAWSNSSNGSYTGNFSNLENRIDLSPGILSMGQDMNGGGNPNWTDNIKITPNGTARVITLVQTSIFEKKQDIEYEDAKESLRRVLSTDVLRYRFKDEVKKGKDIPHIGFVIGGGYSVPSIYKDEENMGITPYDCIADAFGSIKELTRRIETLEEKLAV